MGKFFAVMLVIITLVSVYPIIAHTWWPPPPISTTAPSVDHQLDETMLGSGLLFISSQLILAGFIWSFGGRKGKIKGWPGGPTPVVAFGIIIVSLEILSLTFVGSKVWASMYMPPPNGQALHVDVQAEQFAFFFRYAGPDGVFGGIHPDKISDATGNYFGLDPEHDVASRDDIVVGTLTVPVDTPILLTLHSKDMIHNFYVPELRLQQDIVPGLDIPLHFTVTKTGKWEIVCTQLCGLGHYSMRAFLQVMSKSDFNDWLKQQSGD
ncbi:MAG: cytochrome c oxidase subunit II [Candidatus Acidiferrales bacterium]